MMNSLIFYNTLTKKKEEFKPLNPREVGLYSCGPTVYDYTHIGHLRTYVFVDILKRVLRYNGFKVRHVMNITDVGHLTSEADTGDDKMEAGARREGKTVWEIARFYSDYFFKVMAKMNVSRADVVCKATDHIKEMVELVKRLEEKGFTYKTFDGIYFDTSKLPDYGKLAGLDIEGLKEGARVEKNPEKKNPTDFALWKFSPSTLRQLADRSGQAPVKKRQMEWQSPWGVGFPGWHIECSAMSMKYLGETIDIHTGGIDHIPLHHTNEIAQSEAATGKPFVKYWLHAGHLLIEGEKMSKSLGNFYRLEDVEKRGFHPMALRYLFLTAHYRSTMNFQWSALEGAGKAWERLKEKFSIFNFQFSNKEQRTMLSQEKMAKLDEFKKRFNKYINNDLDMPKVLALVWQVVKSNIPDYDKRDLLVEWDEVLGLGLGSVGATGRSPKLTGVGAQQVAPEIKLLIKKREHLRRKEKWEEADELREQIEEKGYRVEDGEEGTKVKKR